MSTAAQARDLRAREPERVRAYHRDWARARRRELGPIAGLVANYKLTIEQARAVLARRGEACDICGRKAKLCYDHCHTTGRWRGWLCYRCNHGLHMLEDAELLAVARSYLEACRATV